MSTQQVYQTANTKLNTRKSLSMESIPANINESSQPVCYQPNNKVDKITHKNSNNNNNIINSNYHKFGTVSGYTQVLHNRPSIDMHCNELADEATAAAHALANSNRMRAVNRSFRTAVDKSFDVVNLKNINGKFIFTKI